MKPKDNLINEDTQELQDLQYLWRRQKTLFAFKVMVYDRVGYGGKFSNKNFGLGKLYFHVTSHLKFEAKVFFS